MSSSITSIGCSFVRHSIDIENPKRPNSGASPTRPLTQKHTTINQKSLNEETSFTAELGEIMNIPTTNLGIGGTGNRYAIFGLIDYIDKNKVEDTTVLIGVTELTRFDMIKPSHHTRKWPKLPIEIYASYYDKQDTEFEIKALFRMASAYLTSKGISHLFINTMNVDMSTKDIVPTFIFPNGSEYWRRYLTKTDSTYAYEHPNIADHQHLAKLLADKLES